MDPTTFRPAALQSYAKRAKQGRILRLSPAWVDRTFWVLIAAVVAAIAYVTIGKASEYASGPAVVRLDSRTEVPIKADGVIAAVLVKPGDRVDAGTPVVQLDETVQTAEFKSALREYDLELVNRLRDPASTAPPSIGTLQARLQLARSQLAERTLRAPAAGVVGDVRLRPGERVSAGDVALSLIRDDATFSLLAVLPGSYRPMLRPGMPMRFEVSGFEYAYQDLIIASLGDEVVGPAAVKRYLGQETADALLISGPVVLVSARIPARAFRSHDEVYNYYDGMQGRAEARVRTERLIISLIPALRALLPNGN
jgi:membrane fusion protein (multidrug efflux system)